MRDKVGQHSATLGSIEDIFRRFVLKRWTNDVIAELQVHDI